MRLARIAWLITSLICALAAVIALLRGDNGYAAVGFAVALSASINLL